MPTRRQLADAIRVLSMDAIEEAGSGHPGAPLGMADMAEALWRHGLKHSPLHPDWYDRDRFVLSNGHASMLLYALLHLTGYDLSIDEIRNFRQLGSRTPGHPEAHVTPGVDMTTGPLGQGVASAVGMALAERLLAATFNRPGHTIVDHHTYCFLGDGCLMEGVSQEACSLAGTWGLGRLICYYDANGISIDGSVDSWFTEDTTARFKAMGWQVTGPIDGHDAQALDNALELSLRDTARPSLIICRTHIGFGSSKVDSASSHGAPLGKESVAKAREAYGWSYAPFEVPEEIRSAWDARKRGERLKNAWDEAFVRYQREYPELALEFTRRMEGKLPSDFEKVAGEMIHAACAEKKGLATRKSSQKCLEYLTEKLPEMIGGSADLSGSVGTMTSHSKALVPGSFEANYLYYGVREFGMGCIMNGLALHGGFLPYAGTFLSFSDQAKNAIRLGSLMHAHVVWVCTHDSIYVGEDGPTHQPVEQLPTLRMTPNLRVWRPADSVETACAWRDAIVREGMTCLVLSRQTLPVCDRGEKDNDAVIRDIARGGYIFSDCEGEPELIIIATGSELELAVGCAERLKSCGRRVRVVSMPCTDLFDHQPEQCKEKVLPAAVRKRLAIEASSPDFFYKYVGLDGKVIGMSEFGVSGKAAHVAAHFGFSVDGVLDVAKSLF